LKVVIEVVKKTFEMVFSAKGLQHKFIAIKYIKIEDIYFLD
jgi:hypothetical protein